MTKNTSKLESIEVTLAAISKRNEVRAKEVREKLGEKWLLHPSNSPKKNVIKGTQLWN